MKEILESDDPAKAAMSEFGNPENKCCLRNAKDVTRGMITIIDASAGIETHNQFKHFTARIIGNTLVVVYHKDRCQHDEGTDGVWQDELYAIQLFDLDGKPGHICELQLARQKMCIARGELGGHELFDDVRGIIELLAQLGVKIEKTPPLDGEALEKKYLERLEEAKQKQLGIEKELNDARDKAHEMKALAADRGAIIHRNHSTIEGKDAVIEEKDAAVKGSEAVIEGKDAVIEGNEAAIKVKDTAIKGNEAVIEEKDAVIKVKDTVIEEKDAAIEEKDAKLKAAERQHKQDKETIARLTREAEERSASTKHVSSVSEREESEFDGFDQAALKPARELEVPAHPGVEVDCSA